MYLLYLSIKLNSISRHFCKALIFGICPRKNLSRKISITQVGKKEFNLAKI
jgi:hypothetical protein